MTRRNDLIRLLTAYRPRTEQEAGYRLRMLDLAAASDDPFSRHDYQPGHFTGSGFVAHPDGQRVLVIHHRKMGFWVQPGGHIDPTDETAIDAAGREVHEEAGLEDLRPIALTPVHIDIHTFPENADQPEHLHFDLRFGFVAGDPELHPSDEVLDARWVRPNEIVDTGGQESLVEPISRVLA